MHRLTGDLSKWLPFDTAKRISESSYQDRFCQRSFSELLNEEDTELPSTKSKDDITRIPLWVRAQKSGRIELMWTLVCLRIVCYVPGKYVTILSCDTEKDSPYIDDNRRSLRNIVPILNIGLRSTVG